VALRARPDLTGVNMPQAIQIEKAGPAENMKLVDVKLDAPGKGEAQVEHHAIGINYIDVYFRSGLYPQALARKVRESSRRWARA
jgi:NADPH:quinone reductase-like Zn-dependent oxidoreductase